MLSRVDQCINGEDVDVVQIYEGTDGRSPRPSAVVIGNNLTDPVNILQKEEKATNSAKHPWYERSGSNLARVAPEDMLIRESNAEFEETRAFTRNMVSRLDDTTMALNTVGLATEEDDEKEENKNKQDENEETCWTAFQTYMLFIWDGLGFFGSATHKLSRLQGEKVTWLTPLTDAKAIIGLFLMLTVSIYIGVTEISKLGKKRSQTVNF